MPIKLFIMVVVSFFTSSITVTSIDIDFDDAKNVIKAQTDVELDSNLIKFHIEYDVRRKKANNQ